MRPKWKSSNSTPTPIPVVKVDRRIRWHYNTTILRLRIGARLTKYRNCKFHNFAPTISRHADGISRYSVPPSAGPLLPLAYSRWRRVCTVASYLFIFYARRSKKHIQTTGQNPIHCHHLLIETQHIGLQTARH